LAVLLATLAATPVAAASPRVLVVSKENASLQVFDAPNYALAFEIAVPGGPHEVAVSPDGQFAYVGDFEGGSHFMWVIDLASKTHSPVDLTQLARPHGMAVTRDGSKLYLTVEGLRAVAEVDLHTRKLLRTFKTWTDQLHMIVLSPDEKSAFVTSQYDGTVTFFDIAKGEKDRSVRTGAGPEGIAITSDGKELWVANRVDQTVAVVDVPTHKRVHVMACQTNPMRVKLTPDDALVLVSAGLSDELVFIDRASREPVGRVRVGELPIAIAITDSGEQAYVTNSTSAEVTIVDIAKRSLVKRFRVGGKPEGIALVE
jgi:YVTN family beta-propeller protein